MPTRLNLAGPHGQLYADPTPSTDEDAFQVNNTSDAYYSSAYYLANKNLVQPVPPARPGAPSSIDLADYLPADMIAAINAAQSITFHSTGDTGAAKVSAQQNAATALAQQAGVADAMAADVRAGGANTPAFFFHLGDVVYNFGEAQYYYDQFYEPYRTYDRPIFAVPGNHDGMVFGATSTAPQVPTLAAFLTNFCATAPGPSPEAPTIARSMMTQPGVYFTLDAPFVSIIGLYSNVLDTGGGIISSQGGMYPLSDVQLAFLTAELTRLKPQRQAGQRAILIAVHHPPLSCDAKTGGSGGLMQDIDACCKSAGLWPDMLLSGHAHLYQRFTRTVNGRQAPYIVCGSGGFAATAPMEGAPPAGTVVGDHKLEIAPIVQFGYLTITTNGKTLTASFMSAPRNAPVKQLDTVTVDLVNGVLTAGGAVAAPTPVPAPKPVSKPTKKPVLKSAPKPTPKPSPKPSPKPVSKPTKKPVLKSAPKPVHKSKPKPKPAAPKPAKGAAKKKKR